MLLSGGEVRSLTLVHMLNVVSVSNGNPDATLRFHLFVPFHGTRLSFWPARNEHFVAQPSALNRPQLGACVTIHIHYATQASTLVESSGSQ